MSFTLFKNTIKKNFLILIIFICVLIMYQGVMISMYNPESLESFEDMLKLMPEGIVSAMGFSAVASDLAGYIASTLYSFIMFVFPVIYCSILGNRLISKQVDDKSMTYILATPISRTKVATTRGVYALLSILVMFAVVFVMGIIFSESMFKGNLEIIKFLNVNIITMLATMVITMLCFLFSCILSDSKKQIGISCALPIAFILLNMLANADEKLKFLKNLSIYGWYDSVKVCEDGIPLNIALVFIALIVVLLIGGIFTFKRKKLAL